jgi:hypothetical protein
MKGLKKIALASAIAAVAAGAQAELKALDDSTMSEMTGQAGLTIDLETKWTIGEFAYQDAGFVVLQGLSMGGNSNEVDASGNIRNEMLDNIRLEIDIAGAGAVDPANGKNDNQLKYGMSNVQNLALVAYALGGKGGADAGLLAKGAGIADAGGAKYTHATGNSGEQRIDDEVVYGDGDLKIHFTFTDAFQKAGGFAKMNGGVATRLDGTGPIGFATATFQELMDIGTSAVDFEFGIDAIGLASSGYEIGSQGLGKTNHATGAHDGAAETTTLISDLKIRGYLGPADIHIENNGNGFGADGSAQTPRPGTGNADSKIHWDSFFKVTDLEVYIDIAGVQIKELSIHNDRGDTTSLNEVQLRAADGTLQVDGSGNPIMVNTTSLGFAHSKRDIYAVKDNVLNLSTLSAPTGTNTPGYVDGIAINTRFKGDIDIGHLSFGDTGTSIGKIFITDKTATTNWTISAH